MTFNRVQLAESFEYMWEEQIFCVVSIAGILPISTGFKRTRMPFANESSLVGLTKGEHDCSSKINQWALAWEGAFSFVLRPRFRGVKSVQWRTSCTVKKRSVDGRPTTHRPPTDHLPTTYRPPTDNLPTTYRQPIDRFFTVQLVQYYLHCIILLFLFHLLSAVKHKAKCSICKEYPIVGFRFVHTHLKSLHSILCFLRRTRSRSHFSFPPGSAAWNASITTCVR